uniref:Uncharacterized protein n=1 Tax=Acrobeloides nanus TaxID=290746 RepID=A0A914D6K6_9BILA
MLFRVLNIQILLIGITCLIPFCGICALLVLKLNDISHITTILLTPVSFHYTMDFLCLIYFVPPFKLFIAKKFMKVKKVWLCKNSGQITVSTVNNVNIQVPWS